MNLSEFINEWHNGNERLLVHTSGSTGMPKPLWVEKRRMEASARITCNFLQLKEGNTALLCLPLNFIAGKMMVVRSLVQKLKLIAVEPSGHPLSTVGDPIDFAAMIPLQVANSLQVPLERERLKRIRHLIIGGGAIDDELAGELANFPHAVWSTYGMTETLSHIALRRLNGPERSDWYTPFEGVSVSLNNEQCLVIDAPLVCEQRLVTNDIGELTANGCFRILGRRDNVVCSGGVKIQMEEVERLLRPHLPEVPFMITKCKDKKLGEAVVMLYEAGAPTSAHQFCESLLRETCQRVLPRYWQPRHYVKTAHLPTTETGKPARAKALHLATNVAP
jgi:O-succinylbenzoic acid--CoA ligase